MDFNFFYTRQILDVLNHFDQTTYSDVLETKDLERFERVLVMSPKSFNASRRRDR